MKNKLKIILKIKLNYHLLIVAIAFLIFTFSILTESYKYFIKNKFFEGYIIAFQVIVFDIIGLLLTIPYLIKKDFKNLTITGLFYGLLTLIGFLGFNISLVLLPILSIIATATMLRLTFNKKHSCQQYVTCIASDFPAENPRMH
ncbi:hypothetical protein [Mangrovimonas xylaniphaga]|uniref:hypothetical protein n=1 Tax=Mangrovimonas xylaniphaga TaxID=1645915 RepID=UPI0012FA4A14|nr:hypothetical protein [Mangrovimonas xylaniphaga]